MYITLYIIIYVNYLTIKPTYVSMFLLQVIGHPVMVPYWSLGFQLCRWGYDSLDNMKAAVDRTRAAQIPHVSFVLYSILTW
jgi:alpha-glucosidase (family GH31 glycosyl hydrolase)